MTDLNMMMREQAKMGLQAQLDAAVTNGDTEAARKAAADLAKLEVSTAPKAPPFGQAEIMNALETKADWFGVDPKKSAKAVEFGKTMNPKKFATAELFADAVIKAVDAEFTPPAKAKTEDEPGEDDPEEPEDEPEDPPALKKRKTDGPGEADAGARARSARSGPWTKLADAPSNVQAEIKRQADKFVAANAGKDAREKFINKALESHYRQHQAAKGKK